MLIDFDGVALHQVCCGVSLRKILGDGEALRPALFVWQCNPAP